MARMGAARGVCYPGPAGASTETTGQGMDTDDLEPRKPKPKPRDLEAMGVAELNDYIAELEAEIERVRGVITAKTSHRAGAEGLFKR